MRILNWIFANIFRYDQYRHVQPPRHLPRDWDDIRVRHKYYTERGYFARDMTLDELSRWEDWWHRYQQWRRGYERAWVAAHGPHVPVEYPDWTNYRSAHHRESPAAAAAAAAVVAAAAAGSIRNRLGWRRWSIRNLDTTMYWHCDCVCENICRSIGRNWSCLLNHRVWRVKSVHGILHKGICFCNKFRRSIAGSFFPKITLRV